MEGRARTVFKYVGMMKTSGQAGPEEAIQKWSGQGVGSEMLSTCCVNTKGSGGMLPQKNCMRWN